MKRNAKSACVWREVSCEASLRQEWVTRAILDNSLLSDTCIQYTKYLVVCLFIELKGGGVVKIMYQTQRLLAATLARPNQSLCYSLDCDAVHQSTIFNLKWTILDIFKVWLSQGIYCSLLTTKINMKKRNKRNKQRKKTDRCSHNATWLQERLCLGDSDHKYKNYVFTFSLMYSLIYDIRIKKYLKSWYSVIIFFFFYFIFSRMKI